MCFSASGQAIPHIPAIEIEKIEVKKHSLKLSVTFINDSKDPIYFDSFFNVMHFSMGYTKTALKQANDTIKMDRTGFFLQNQNGAELDPLSFFNIFFHKYASLSTRKDSPLKSESFFIPAHSKVGKCIKINMKNVTLPSGYYSLNIFKYISSSDELIESSWESFRVSD